MLSLRRDEDRELLELLKQYNKKFKTELIENDVIKQVEKNGFLHLLAPFPEKEKLKSMLKKAIENNKPLVYPDDIMEADGFTKEKIESYKKGELLI